ncbi:carbohydrate-binding module family 29 protein [Piromyces sp. E2]|nr:carbohydrate-binding module family 29 protein [Piromyces sp. E2]|eukprot:OUM69330.1 carbohydrate-binding module family 29 protein [Piromyces sp. E2]
MFKQIGITALLVASASAACWSESQGFKCCSSANAKVEYTDDSGDWGIENGNWCGIPKEEKVTCFAENMGYSCCPAGTEVAYTDGDGKWGVVDGNWCGIVDSTPVVVKPTCWAEPLGYKCCQTTNVVTYTDESGKWGMENDDWCGIVGNGKTTTTTRRTTTTTTRRTTTTTRRAARATYSVIYEAGKKLNNGFENWGWLAKLSYKDSAMVITSDKSEYGAASFKNKNGYYGTGGCIHLLSKTENTALIKVQGVYGEDETEAFSVGTVRSSDDFVENKFEVDDTLKFDRIIIQDGQASGVPINVRYLIYSTGSCDDFNPPVDTSKVPVVTTTKKSNVRSTYTVIFKNASGMPNGYDNWGWDCSISYYSGAMIITPKEGKYGAVSLKRNSGSFNGGSIRFDMKNEGPVKILVENSSKDEKFEVDTIQPSDDYETYIFDIDFDLPFDRIDFQDANGSGSRIWVKNLIHSTGAAEDFSYTV